MRTSQTPETALFVTETVINIIQDEEDVYLRGPHDNLSDAQLELDLRVAKEVASGWKIVEAPSGVEIIKKGALQVTFEIEQLPADTDRHCAY